MSTKGICPVALQQTLMSRCSSHEGNPSGFAEVILQLCAQAKYPGSDSRSPGRRPSQSFSGFTKWNHQTLESGVWETKPNFSFLERTKITFMSIFFFFTFIYVDLTIRTRFYFFFICQLMSNPQLTAKSRLDAQ